MATVSRAAVTRKAPLTAIYSRVDAASERFEDSSRVSSVAEHMKRVINQRLVFYTPVCA